MEGWVIRIHTTDRTFPWAREMFWGEPKSSWYCPTSCTSSSSFPSKEVTFNVRSQCAQFPCHRRPPSLQHTWPQFPALQLVSPLGRRPLGPRPGHHMLTSELPSQPWLQEGALVSLFSVRYSSTLVSFSSESSESLFVWPLPWAYQGLIAPNNKALRKRGAHKCLHHGKVEIYLY